MTLTGDDLDQTRHDMAVWRRNRDSTIPRGLRRDLAALQWDPENTAAGVACARWRDGHHKGVVLTGTMGVGKTSIAAAAAWERSLKHPIVYVSVPLLLQHMARAFNDAERATALGALTARGGLVLDDLDKVKASEWSSAQLLAAIDSRVQDDRPLLVTMNRTLGELAEKLGREYGGPIASRLAGYCEVVSVGGPDRRLKGTRR